MTSSTQPRLTVWNEDRHELENPEVSAHYPDGIHMVIADGLRAHGFEGVQTATLDQPEHGLTDEVLENTDVLLWWGHKAHGDVSAVQGVSNAILPAGLMMV